MIYYKMTIMLGFMLTHLMGLLYSRHCQSRVRAVLQVPAARRPPPAAARGLRPALMLNFVLFSCLLCIHFV